MGNSVGADATHPGGAHHDGGDFARIDLEGVGVEHHQVGDTTWVQAAEFIAASKGLRAECVGTGVRVTSIEPGMVETEFTLVRTGGDQTASDTLYAGVNPLTGADIADVVLWVASQPPHVNINALELMPVNQSFAGFQVARDT